MPSGALILNISGVGPGLWMIRTYAMFNGKFQHPTIGRFPATTYVNKITMNLYDVDMKFDLGTKPIDSLGRCKWDGSIFGTDSDTSKKTYRLTVILTTPELTIKVPRDIKLGYYDWEYSEEDANMVVWSKWANHIFKMWDSGQPWWRYKAPEGDWRDIPYLWWVGYSLDEFLCDMENHIYNSDEPQWRERAPDINARVTALPAIKKLASCPVCGTKLWFVETGVEVKCPICGFVSAYTRKEVEVTPVPDAQGIGIYAV